MTRRAPVIRCAVPRCPYLGRWAAGLCPIHLPSTTPTPGERAGDRKET